MLRQRRFSLIGASLCHDDAEGRIGRISMVCKLALADAVELEYIFDIVGGQRIF